MAEEYSVDDPTQLLEASSEFANYPGKLSPFSDHLYFEFHQLTAALFLLPGVQNDASAHEFLVHFPLPVIRK